MSIFKCPSNKKAVEKLIFLDIDGVLNSAHDWPENHLSQSLTDNLKHIVNKTNAKIVLSSSWKNFFADDLAPLNKLGNTLIEHFAKNNLMLYAKTPSPNGNYSMERGFEIKTYLQDHPCDNYVIIDDEIFPDFKSTIDMSKFIRTKSGTRQTKVGDEGLTLDLANKAVSILNSKCIAAP